MDLSPMGFNNSATDSKSKTGPGLSAVTLLCPPEHVENPIRRAGGQAWTVIFYG